MGKVTYLRKSMVTESPGDRFVENDGQSRGEVVEYLQLNTTQRSAFLPHPPRTPCDTTLPYQKVQTAG